MERINDGDVEGEYTDSEIPDEPTPETARHAATEEPGEYTDSEIPGEPDGSHGAHSGSDA